MICIIMLLDYCIYAHMFIICIHSDYCIYNISRGKSRAPPLQRRVYRGRVQMSVITVVSHSTEFDASGRITRLRNICFAPRGAGKSNVPAARNRVSWTHDIFGRRDSPTGSSIGEQKSSGNARVTRSILHVERFPASSNRTSAEGCARTRDELFYLRISE